MAYLVMGHACSGLLGHLNGIIEFRIMLSQRRVVPGLPFPLYRDGSPERPEQGPKVIQWVPGGQA